MAHVLKGDERRASARFATTLDGNLVSSRGSKQAVKITDLSTDGFNTRLRPQSHMDSVGYAIKFAGLETLGAELRWSGPEEAGFRFDRPLHPAVLDHVVRAHAPANDADSEHPPAEPI